MINEKRVSLGLLYTDQDILRKAISTKLDLFKSTYEYLKNRKDESIVLPFDKMTFIQLEKLKRSKPMEVAHKAAEKIMIEMSVKYGEKRKNSIIETAISVESEMTNLIRAVHKDELLIVTKCTPEWAVKEVYNELPKTNKKEKAKRKTEIKEVKEVKEYKKGIVWFQIDPSYLELDIDQKGNPILGSNKWEDIQFPMDTVLFEHFPEDFIKRAAYSREIQNLIGTEKAGELKKLKHNMEIASFKEKQKQINKEK